MSGSLRFKYKNYFFRLKSIGTQNINSGMGGSYLVLDCEVSHPIHFFMGPLESYQYISIGSLSKEYAQFTLDEDKHYILKTGSAEKTKTLIDQIKGNSEIKKIILELLVKKFQYIRGRSELEFDGFYLKKKHFIQLSYIEHHTYDSPETLESTIDLFIRCLNHLDVITSVK